MSRSWVPDDVPEELRGKETLVWVITGVLCAGLLLIIVVAFVDALS